MNKGVFIFTTKITFNCYNWLLGGVVLSMHSQRRISAKSYIKPLYNIIATVS